MAVAWVSPAYQNKDEASSTTLTIASVNGGAGNFLTIWVSWRRTATQAITSITYDGSATGITQIGSTFIGGGAASAMYYLVSPAGTADLVITWDVAPTSQQGSVNVFSGVDTGSPVGTHATSASSGTDTTTAAVTSSTDGMCVDGLVVRGNPTNVLPDAGQDARTSQVTSAVIHHKTSTEPGAESVEMGWTWTTGTGETWQHMTVPILPAAGGGGAVRLRRTRSLSFGVG